MATWRLRNRLYLEFLSIKTWVEDLHQYVIIFPPFHTNLIHLSMNRADLIFIVAHSQGSIISIQLLDRLIQTGHIHTEKNWNGPTRDGDCAGRQLLPLPPDAMTQRRSKQRVCCLVLRFVVCL